MSAEGKAEALHKAIRLILEEIEGCNMDKMAAETKELMRLVYEFEGRIKRLREVTEKKQESKAKRHPFKAKVDTEVHQVKPKAKRTSKAWKFGPLAEKKSEPIPKPPWYEGA